MLSRVRAGSWILPFVEKYGSVKTHILAYFTQSICKIWIGETWVCQSWWNIGQCFLCSWSPIFKHTCFKETNQFLRFMHPYSKAYQTENYRKFVIFALLSIWQCRLNKSVHLNISEQPYDCRAKSNCVFSKNLTCWKLLEGNYGIYYLLRIYLFKVNSNLCSSSLFVYC